MIWIFGIRQSNFPVKKKVNFHLKSLIISKSSQTELAETIWGNTVNPVFFSVPKVFSNNLKEQTFKSEVTLFLLAVVASILLAMCLLSFSTNFAAETNFLPDQDLQKKAQTLGRPLGHATSWNQKHYDATSKFSYSYDVTR